MVGTLTPRIEKGQRTMLLPGATEAEPWEVWSSGANARCLQVCQKPGDHSAFRNATLALPVAQVLALPLWLSETDSRQFRDMIELQLESRGLRPRGRDAVFDFSVTAQAGSRTLVLVGVLPAALPEDLESHSFRDYEVSARCLPLPDGALTLWTEQDRLVLAMTREGSLAYFHALPDASLTIRALQDLTCVITGLQIQGVIESLKRAVVWTEMDREGVGRLEALLGLPVEQEPRPAPRAPAQRWSLVPGSVREIERKRGARRWWLKGVMLAVLILLALAVALGLRFFLAERDVARLRQWQADHASSLQMIHQTEAAWRDLRPVIDTASYPPEVLLHVSGSLPADQVRLTLYEAKGDHLLITAEAKNVAAAFQFFDALKANPHLGGYTWTMAQPHSLANDVTQLQIEGTHATHD